MPRRMSAAPKLSVLILAAGQGKRMKSDLPKVLQPLAGQPLLAHVLDTRRWPRAAATYVVYGHGGERVRSALAAAPDCTGCCRPSSSAPAMPCSRRCRRCRTITCVLVLYGDVPLLRAETLKELVALAGPRSLALLTVTLDDPTGYGRIVRDRRGQVLRIVEQKDATARELRIREGNTGVLVAPAGPMRKWLARLRNDNAQGEYYLTDVIAHGGEGTSCASCRWRRRRVTEVLGVNDKLQLAELEAAYRRRARRGADARRRDDHRSGAHRRARRDQPSGATCCST